MKSNFPNDIINPQDWVCTDVDNMQFCRRINGTTFEYVQLKESARESIECGSYDISDIIDKTMHCDWYHDTINVDDYDAEEIGEYLSDYPGLLDNVTKQEDINMLIAECIFETDLFS